MDEAGAGPGRVGDQSASVWAVPGESRPSPLADGLAQVRAGIAALRAGSQVLGDRDCRDGVRDVDALLAELESCWLGLVADLDTRSGAVPGVRAGAVAVSFVSAGLNRSFAQAKRDVAAAKALRTMSSGHADLQLVGEAFAAGEVTRAHVDVAVRCMASIPVRVQEAIEPETGLTGRARVDAYLAEQARLFDPVHLARLGKHLAAVLDSEADEKLDEERYLRRRLNLHEASDGMTVGSFQLEPAGAVVVRSALAHFARPERDGDSSQREPPQGELPVKDERSTGQRYADALVEICRLAMDADPASTRREPAHVLLITTPEQLAAAHSRPDAHALLPQYARPQPDPGSAFWPTKTTGTGRPATPGEAAGLAEAAGIGPLSPATLGLLTCDAILQPVVLDSRSGAILNLGRDQRTASKAQRRALAVRDRGCVIPGCSAPPDRCDAHHITYWSAGGRTDIDDLTLACEAHHLQIHLGLWKLVLVEGVPHVQPPAWHHLAGSGPLRNRLHDAVDHGRRLAQQLHLDLRPGDPPGAEAA